MDNLYKPDALTDAYAVIVQKNPTLIIEGPRIGDELVAYGRNEFAWYNGGEFYTMSYDQHDAARKDFVIKMISNIPAGYSLFRDKLNWLVFCGHESYLVGSEDISETLINFWIKYLNITKRYAEKILES